MLKRGGGTRTIGRKSTKRRFFVLKADIRTLLYYEPDAVCLDGSNNLTVNPKKQPKGFIQFTSGCRVTRPTERHISLTTDGTNDVTSRTREYVFECESEVSNLAVPLNFVWRARHVASV